MNRKLEFFLFIGMPVILTTMGEFLLKFTINQASHSVLSESVISTLTHWIPFVSEGIIRSIATITYQSLSYISQPGVAIGTLFVVTGSILWVSAMNRFELSFMYPFLSLNYLCIVIGSQLLLGESVGLYRYIAVGFVAIGLILISKSHHQKNTDPD